MTSPVIWPDVELYLCGYLRTALATYDYEDIFVSNRRETQTVAVWVRRDGGAGLDQIREGPRVGVNVYAATEKAATDLARTVSALLRAATASPILRVVQVTGPSPIPDAVCRRFMSFEFVVRGAALPLPV